MQRYTKIVFLMVSYDCDVIFKMKLFPFAKLFIEIIDNSQTKRVRDLKILPDLEHRLKIKISIITKGNILRCFLLQNDWDIAAAFHFCERAHIILANEK